MMTDTSAHCSPVTFLPPINAASHVSLLRLVLGPSNCIQRHFWSVPIDKPPGNQD